MWSRHYILVPQSHRPVIFNATDSLSRASIHQPRPKAYSSQEKFQPEGNQDLLGFQKGNAKVQGKLYWESQKVQKDFCFGERPIQRRNSLMVEAQVGAQPQTGNFCGRGSCRYLKQKDQSQYLLSEQAASSYCNPQSISKPMHYLCNISFEYQIIEYQIKQSYLTYIRFDYLFRMGSKPPKPKKPEKTLKEQVAQYTKEMGKMRREFQRECMKLQMNDKKMQKELKKLMKENSPNVNKRSLAQNILKNQKFIAKYKKLDAQLQSTMFELQSMATMDQMANVINGMATIMAGAKNKVKIQQFQNSMKTYSTQRERMQLMNEMIQDSMEVEEDVEDGDVDALIAGMEKDVRMKKEKQAEQDLMADDEQA